MRVVAQPAVGAQGARPDQAEPAAARGLRRVDGRTATAVVAVIARARVVVTQAEEPDQPEHEQSDVEDSEADHEDPALRAHALIVPRNTLSSPSSKASDPSWSAAASSSIDPTT